MEAENHSEIWRQSPKKTLLVNISSLDGLHLFGNLTTDGICYKMCIVFKVQYYVIYN